MKARRLIIGWLATWCAAALAPGASQAVQQHRANRADRERASQATTHSVVPDFSAGLV